ncbi:MAG: MBL fold metallo-hydrolase [Pseudomonadota bacterium]
MIFEHLAAGPLMVNCFVLGDETSKEGLVIDPGGNVPDILKILGRHGLQLGSILLTHGHWDHTGGVDELKKKAGGRIRIGKLEHYRGFQPDEGLSEGDEIAFGRLRLKTLETPGHSPGGTSFVLSEAGSVFVGDLLFAGSIGRTDLPGGSFETLVKSVKEKIFPLGDAMKVFPGHGPMTTVSNEKNFNPFLRGV